MVSFSIEFTHFLLPFILLISLNLQRSNAEPFHTNFNAFSFDEIKLDFFFNSDFNIKNFKNKTSIKDVQKCLTELNAIKDGLSASENWAIKTIDAWGKIPSAWYSGNSYEFGGFSECFTITRDDEVYETRYCLGHLIFNFPTGFAANSVDFPYSNANTILQKINDSSVTPFVTVPKPKSNTFMTLGLCVPASCSLDVLEPIINEIIHQKTTIVSVEFPNNTCQLTEYLPFELKTVDKVAIGVFATVLGLILLSTGYDLLCTVNNRNKIPIFLAFSFYTNGMKLLSYKNTAGMMHCIHGIRVISTGWIVLGHTLSTYLSLPFRNQTALLEYVSTYRSMIILSAYIGVDTFFMLSGLLASIAMLNHLNKTNGKLNIPLLYVHRYLRLTPLLAISILFTVSLLRFLGNGPLWPNQIESFSQHCEQYWWTTLLYVQNYVNPSELCLGHTWYLSIDFQLFLLAPIIVYLIYWFKKKAISILSLFVLGCIGCTIAVHLEYKLKWFFQEGKKEKAYYPTHIRYSSWLIGALAGYFFVEVRQRSIRIPKMFNLIAWAFSMTVMAVIIFANYPLQQLDSQRPPLEYGLYDALSRAGWSIALCYIIFACIHGYGGPINSFLSHPLWQPLSRISYAVYLLHFFVIVSILGPIKTPNYFSELNVFHAFIGNYVMTAFVSIIATLAFESPIVVIEKMIFGPRSKPKPIKKSDETE